MNKDKTKNILIAIIIVIILAIVLIGVFARRDSTPVDEPNEPIEEEIKISESTLDRYGNLVMDLSESNGKYYYLEKDRLIAYNFKIIDDANGDKFFNVTVKNITNQDIDLSGNYSIVLYDKNNKEIDTYDGSIVGVVNANSSTTCEMEITSSVMKLLFRRVD